MNEQFIKLLSNELNYWCDQYIFALDKGDNDEAEKIKETIIALSKVYTMYNK